MIPTADDVRAVLDTVPDPEMPPVSVAELGMVVDVRVDPASDGAADVEVDLVATFAGCPALSLIEADVRSALTGMEGVRSARVRFVNDTLWEPERITGSGRAKLAEFGIAPPGSGQTLVQIGPRPQGVRCPLCGSRKTVLDSPFGPTPCRSTNYCADCRNPFEAIKP